MATGTRPAPWIAASLTAEWHAVRRLAAGGLLSALAAGVLLLAMRRLFGALGAPLNGAALLTAGGAMSGLAAAAFAAAPWLRADRPPEAARRDPLVVLCRWLVATSVVLFAVCVSLPRTPWPALVAFWVVVCPVPLMTALLWWRDERQARLGRAPSAPGSTAVEKPAPAGGAAPAVVAARVINPATTVDAASVLDHPGAARLANDTETFEPDEPPDDTLRQRLERRREPDGRDRLHGWVRVDFATGARSATAHVAFCPPFAAPPQIAWEVTEGPEVRVTLGQALPFGARWDLKRSGPTAAAESVLLEIDAWGPAAERDD